MSSAPLYNQRLHRFTIFYAACVLLLIVAGALVTSNDAGLAVPDWPTSFGSFYRIPPMVGGVKYEHGHRMLAQFVGLLTIIFAVWVQRTDPRPWMRKLGWSALALVLLQGVLGGMTVLHLLPWYISTAHAMLAQTFFSLVALAMVFTSRSWIESSVESRVESLPVESSANAPSTSLAGDSRLQALSVLCVSAIYTQLFFGAAFRHTHAAEAAGTKFIMPFWPHLLGAIVTTVIIAMTIMRALTKHGRVEAIRRPAAGMIHVLLTQLLLGGAAYMTRVVWGRNAPQPLPSMIVSTVLHVAIGAVLLATSWVLLVQVFRLLGGERTSARGIQVVTA